ncbi:uncharacterized protein LOC128362339 [Scomber japonicus]|uniref:uncharacterized protein LOC128362339 n=1 Tax=Scomber japonicus TaxID=13676 RepID=UPI00230648EF|nr:uncharacterized protein LOC128362339 [Scomber japonicus]
MLSCHHSSDPHITDVGLVYDYNNDTGNLWQKNGPLSFCSSISAPSASSCVVCVEQGVNAVCGHLVQAVELVMEAAGGPIEIIKSECPRLLGDGLLSATVQSATESPGINPDTRERWPVVIPIVITILLVLLMVYCILKKNRSTSEPKIKGEKNGDTFYLSILEADIVKPEAEVQSGKKEAAAHLNVSVADADADEQEPKAVN